MFKLTAIFALALAAPGLSLPSRATRSVEMCEYYLFTRTNPVTPVTIDPTDIATTVTNAVKTTILVHGHQGALFSSLNPIVTRELLVNEDVNVIVVDWSAYASGSYSDAVNVVPAVAASLNSFITALAPTVSQNLIHIVGFNLGAHVAGIAARTLDTKVARITGLDPSGSRWGRDSARLRFTDATYVEVLHTDGGGLLANGLGEAIGHVDFFANGGNNQPGCVTHTCCHERAFELFAASMANPRLIGNACSTNLQVNLNLCRGVPLRLGTNDITKTGVGIYRVNTGRFYPF